VRCVNGDTAAAVAGVNFFFRPIFLKFVTLSQLTRALLPLKPGPFLRPCRAGYSLILP
jgi:hypothetical protein